MLIYAEICNIKPKNKKGKRSKIHKIQGFAELYNIMQDMTKILFVCHGNICRSTMAESVMTHLIKQEHFENFFEIASAATSREEIGNPPHYGTVNKLRSVGIPLVPHHAIQMTKQDYHYYQYLIGMDTANIRNMTRIAGGDPDDKIYKLLSFAGSGKDVADPWYTGDFDTTYQDIINGCTALLRHIIAQEHLFGKH